MSPRLAREPYFTQYLFQFLAELKANNTKSWFEANRERLQFLTRTLGLPWSVVEKSLSPRIDYRTTIQLGETPLAIADHSAFGIGVSRKAVIIEDSQSARSTTVT